MRALQRTGLTALVLGALGTGFVAGLNFDSSASPSSTSLGTPRHSYAGRDDIRLVNADLRPATSCDQLLAWYVDHGVDRVTAYGWDYIRFYDLASVGGSAEPAEATSSATGTNVQEAGVDEPDVVKTDGSLLVRVDYSRLVIYDVTGAQPVRVGSLPIHGMYEPELLLAGDRVVVVGRQGGPAGGRIAAGTVVQVVDISDPGSPAVVHETTYDSSLVTARQHGDVVRLVVSVGLPDLDFVEPGLLRRENVARERNQAVVRASTIDDWLPHVTTVEADGSVREQLLGCDDVAIPAADTGLGTVVVAAFDVHDPAIVSATAVSTPSQTVYVSADRLYLASSPYQLGWEACCWDVMLPGPVDDGTEGRTHLYEFDLDGTTTTYAASGRVDGVVVNRWAMDEQDGVLRLAVGPTTRTGDGNSVVTVARSGSHLEQVGRVDGLGVGEQIQSVRWLDDLAVVVTFRQTDPFYAVDLSDPDDLVLLGELKIPGFSSYLHPIGDDLVIGVGADASPTGQVRGAKASLFDIADPTAPRELDTVVYPHGLSAAAGFDPRQFTWLPDRRTALTVISSGWGTGSVYVSVLRIDGGTLVDELVPVEYDVQVGGVRLVPLPDGRVVLSTDDEATFFPLVG